MELPSQHSPPAAGTSGVRKRAKTLRYELERAEECRLRGDHIEGADHARRAADLAHDLRDIAGHAQALRLLGLHLFRLGDLEESAKACDQSAQMSGPLHDHAGESNALSTLAMAYVELGLHDEALKAVAGCLNAAKATGDKTLLCWAYNRFGVVHDSMDQRPLGHRFLSEALTLARELEQPEPLFSALNNLSENAIGLHHYHRERAEDTAAVAAAEHGLQYALEGVEQARASGNAHREAICRCNLGMLTGLTGAYDQAFSILDESQRLAQQKAYRPLLLMLDSYRAELLCLRGERAAAIAAFNQLLATAPEQADRVLLMRVHLRLSHLYKEDGHYREALAHHERYHAVNQQITSSVADVRARMLINRLELDQMRLLAERARLEADLHQVRSAELEQEKQQLIARSVELGRHAHEDPLTGLWNRRYVETALNALHAEAAARGRHFCLIIGDIDRFKSINDRFGHPAGDQVLRLVAAVFKAGCRPLDLVARVGGEEFMLLLADTALAPAVQICTRLLNQIETQNWSALHPQLTVTMSFGIADSSSGSDVRQLLAEADHRLYEAKRKGRNRIESEIAPPA